MKWQSLLSLLLLALLVAAGYWMRSTGRNWDDFTHLHPDERFLTDVASRIRTGSFQANSVEQDARCRERYGELLEKPGYFDADCSRLNPNNIGFGLYVYGQFPLFTTRVAGETLREVEKSQCLAAAATDEARAECEFLAQSAHWTSYNGIHFAGRMVSSLADTLAIVLVFLIGHKLFGRWPGLLAAAFYTFAAFPIQQSHFWTADVFTGLWVLLALYAAVNVLDDDSRRPAAFTPLLWIAAACAVWVYELSNLEALSLLPLLLYGAVMGLGSLAGTWARQARHLPYLLLGGAGLLLLLPGGLLLGGLTLAGAGLAALLCLLLLALHYAGLERLAAYGGTLPWLMAAFGIWVFDSLAYQESPQVLALVIYLVIFAITALLGGALLRARHRGEGLLWLLGLGLPLLLWMGLSVMLDILGWQGALVAAGLALLLLAATATGYRDYAAFGLAFGGALAGRVNVLPVVGVLLLVLIIRTLPVLDRQAYATLRYRLLSRATLGLMVAALFTLLAFRFMQPHAFSGPGIIPTGLNEGWMEDIAEAQRLVSGEVEIPPNWQWVNRVPWLFPGQNIVLYGLGAPLGLVAVAALLWAALIIILGRPGWTRLAPLSAWILVYFGWLGGNWVTTMRYFLPIYGPLVLLAAWGLWRVLGMAWGYYQRDAVPRGLRRAALAMATAALLLVLGHTVLYGYGMTSIYRHVLTRVAATLWFQENVPGNFGMWIETEEGERVLQNFDTGLVGNPFYVSVLQEGESHRFPLTVQEVLALESVVLHRVADVERDEQPEGLAIRILYDDGLGERTLAERELRLDLNVALSEFGDEYSIRFDDEGETLLDLPGFVAGIPAPYQLEIEVLSGGALAFSRSISDGVLPINLEHLTLYTRSLATGEENQLGFQLDDSSTPIYYTHYLPNQPGTLTFTARADGSVQEVLFPHIADPFNDPGEETLRVQVTGLNGEYAYGELTQNFPHAADGQRQHGVEARVLLEPPLQVQAGTSYEVSVITDEPLLSLGTVIGTEGGWDDSIPYNLCPLPTPQPVSSDLASGYTHHRCSAFSPYPGYYRGVEMGLALEDDESKRQILINALDESDYLTISSNRFYDSLSRIPYRWPMSLVYYEALFNEELGFELVGLWESYPRIDWLGLEWRDQVLPTDKLPAWRNEFEVEEAFTVYDHPTVFVFRKRADYDPLVVREVLDVPLREYKTALGGLSADTEPVNRNVLNSLEASEIPTALMLSAAAEAANASVSWRDLYPQDALVNGSETIAVLVWWLLMIAVGWLSFPLLFAAFPGLADRGFVVAKLVGWMLVAWLAWVGASLHLGTWSQGGILLCLLLLGLLSAGFAWVKRGEMADFFRERLPHLVWLEVLTLALFLAFLLVRMGNPDLWHNSFGGEKPMNFAYFNAVLRSETFPPLDPWFAGGYINYYYWGYVLVGAPVKLLGMLPARAYNIIIPTLFAMTSMGAFSVAYNLVAARRQATSNGDLQRGPRGNPWVAGIAALLLVAVLGNLDTPRVFATAVAQLGGWGGPGSNSLTLERQLELREDFILENGREPSFEEQQVLDAEAADPSSLEETAHSVERFAEMMGGFVEGVQILVENPDTALPMHTHRWYWAPTRIIGELPEGKGHNAINEMPYFTFLYGDLHAHMMAMPLMLLVLLWLVAELASAGTAARGWAALLAALFIGGLAVGLLRAINTWDFPTFLILGVVGLTLIAWVRQLRRREGAPRVAFYGHLRRYLDWGQLPHLWGLIFLLPLGVFLYTGLYFAHSRSYQSKLDAGLVPQGCQQLDPDTPTLQIPSICEGLLKPQWSLGGALLWGLGALGLAVVAYVAMLVFFGARFEKGALLAWLGQVGFFLLVAFAAVIPFTYYNASHAALIPWEAERTPLWAFLDIHGLFLFIVASFFAWATLRRLQSIRVADLRGLGVPLLLVLGGTPLLLLASLVLAGSIPVMLVTLPLIAWGMALFLVPGSSHAERLVYIWLVLALGIATGVELFGLNVDIGRQNMVFKFYMQVWLLFGVGGGVALAWLIEGSTRWHLLWRGLWQFGLVLLFTVALLYPVVATQARWLDRFDGEATGRTLDGQAYMDHAVYGMNGIWFNFRGDHAMIDWMNRSIEGTPRIIEAQAVEYQWGSRIAINTGLPTLLGWNFHQRQQRSLYNLDSQVWNRANNITAFYTSPSIGQAWDLIEFYDLDYIIVGDLERILYGDVSHDISSDSFSSGLSPGIAKFDEMVALGLLELVYDEPSCIIGAALSAEECPPARLVRNRIYRVRPGATYDDSLEDALADG